MRAVSWLRVRYMMTEIGKLGLSQNTIFYRKQMLQDQKS